MNMIGMCKYVYDVYIYMYIHVGIPCDCSQQGMPISIKKLTIAHWMIHNHRVVHIDWLYCYILFIRLFGPSPIFLGSMFSYF